MSVLLAPFAGARRQGRFPALSRSYASTASPWPRRHVVAICPPAFVHRVPPFPVPTALRRVSRTLQFWGRVVSIWSSFKAVQLYVTLQRPFRDHAWERRVWDAQHARAAEMMYSLCVDLRGFFVKSGQLIALQSFVPKVIREKLSKLHDDMPPMPPAQALAAIEAELSALGRSLSDFRELDVEGVLGSASIAQVHRGVLRGSAGARDVDVAVKIQTPDNEPAMMADLANYRVLAELLQRTELKVDLVRPIVELRRQIALEFDFAHEARAMDLLGRALRGVRGVVVPRPVPGLVSRRLLVMTFVPGVPMTRLHTLAQPPHTLSARRVRRIGRRILRRLSEAYKRMIVRDGFFHADCHPGNIVVMNRRVDIGLLDFGQTKRLPERVRASFVRLVDAMDRADADGMRDALHGMGISLKYVGAWKGRDTAEARRRARGKTPEAQLCETMFNTRVTDGVSDNPFAADSALRSAEISDLPEDVLFLLRTMQIMRGIAKMTDNRDFSVIARWRHAARDEVRKLGGRRGRVDE